MTETAERPELTDRQKAVYKFIVTRLLDGHSVGLRDVAREFKFGTNAASNHLKALATKGYLSPCEGRMNSLRPTNHEYRIDHGPGVVTIRTTGPVTVTSADLLKAVSPGQFPRLAA